MDPKLVAAFVRTLASALSRPASARMDGLGQASNGDNWAAYGRTYNEDHFSPLTQIGASNVARLGLV